MTRPPARFAGEMGYPLTTREHGAVARDFGGLQAGVFVACKN